MAKTVGDIRQAIDGVSDAVPFKVNGRDVELLDRRRNRVGDLELHAETGVPVAPLEDARDPDAIDAKTGENPGENPADDPDLGDAGSETEPL